MKCSDRPFPQQVQRLAPDETFIFRCHSGVACFNECCRLLDLALTPYDVLRLKNNLQIDSAQFLEQYTFVDLSATGGFPEVYLGMIDDGQGRCPFVNAEGCRVYTDRPSACRTYPVGRGVFLSREGETKEVHILLHEPHCLGFCEKSEHTIQSWIQNQELDFFNISNDSLLSLLQHNAIKQGRKLSQEEQQLFVDTFYDLDGFRRKVEHEKIGTSLVPSQEIRNTILSDQTALLDHGVRWLKQIYFKE